MENVTNLYFLLSLVHRVTSFLNIFAAMKCENRYFKFVKEEKNEFLLGRTKFLLDKKSFYAKQIREFLFPFGLVGRSRSNLGKVKKEAVEANKRADYRKRPPIKERMHERR